MFFWPHLELTEYEKRFVSTYGTPGVKADPKKGIKEVLEKPGVLRRTYKVLMNNTQHPTISGMEDIHLNGGIQISRASRVFALTFAGDIHAWRLRISLASGTDFTPRLSGGTYPMVCTLSPASSWNSACFLSEPSQVNVSPVPETVSRQIAWQQLPFIIDPNWELDPNETLLFEGEPQNESALILEIAAHVWEFPGMIRGMDGPEKGEKPRMGGGPALSTGRC
jgi:hypothetical protein